MISPSSGFLPTTIDGTRRGNYGLMDIIAALRWVQENIGEMGGNPDSVTIIGSGFRGGGLANLLMLSPLARGKCYFEISTDTQDVSHIGMSCHDDFYANIFLLWVLGIPISSIDTSFDLLIAFSRLTSSFPLISLI